MATTYKLPQHIACALATNRPELLSLVQPSTELEGQLLKLLADLIQDRQQVTERLEHLHTVVASAAGVIRNAAEQVDKTISQAHGQEVQS